MNIASIDERNFLRVRARELHQSERMTLFDDRDWTSRVPAVPGVYALWERTSGRPIYVGETANLQARMRDFGRYPNHTCRRKLAKSFRLSSHQEEQISAAIGRTYELSYLEIRIGRVELEEYLSVLWTDSLINRPGRRHLERYSWVMAGDRRPASQKHS